MGKRTAQRQGWWTDFDDEVLEGVLGGFDLSTHIGLYEADATVERIYTLPLVPALPADRRVRDGDLPEHGRSFR